MPLLAPSEGFYTGADVRVVDMLLAGMAHRIRPALQRYGRRFNRICGGAFAAVGVAVAMTR